MERRKRFYNFLFLLALQIACSSSQLCSQDQYLALLQFKNSFSTRTTASSACAVSYPKTSTWKRGTDCCSWNGVECDGLTGNVISLDLSCSRLYGNVLPNNSLFSFHHLKKLNLAYNDFNMSQISSEFGMLTYLTHLNLSSSVFDGKIPSEISYLSGLVSLDVSYNYGLSIEPPSLISIVRNLTVLRELVLDSVNLSSVPPSSFTNLSSSLKLLGLGSCALQGDFPGEVFQLPYLETLRFSYNFALSGRFPKSNMSSFLQFLDISLTNFSGQLPDSVCKLKSLKTLSLSNCKLTGPIPLCFGNLTQITSLDFSFNSFDGQIPPSFSKLERLIHLDISSNNFSGQIPESFSNFQQLVHLDLVSNNFTGQIPNIFGNLTHISYIDFSLNRLTGSIPSQVIGLSNLTSFSMSANKLNGTIPSWLFNHPSLVHLDLSSNMLTGSIGEFRSRSYDFISLGDNKLSGSIPSSIFEQVNLTQLHLYSNNLSGSLDLDLFAKQKKVFLLNLSYNKLSLRSSSNGSYKLPELVALALSSCNMTKFPKFLRAAENIIELHLSENNIQGPIPKWALKMWKDSLQVLNLGHNSLTHVEKIPWRKLDILNLQSNLLQGHLPVPPPTTTFFSVANNQLNGEIPSQICDMNSLQVLDLSNNSLSGMIPTCLGNFSNDILALDLGMNNLSGTIPATFPEGSSLKNLALNTNQLEGNIPQSLVNCKMLEILDVGNNDINDTFPHFLETLPRLKVLVLRSNKFHGPITSQNTLFSFPVLRIMDIAHNEFTGLLPTHYIRNLKGMMNVVDKYDTPLQSVGPGNDYYQDSVLVTMKGFQYVLVGILNIFTAIDVSGNRFQGQIPDVVGNLSSLRVLNFSHNGLTGHIPTSLGELTLLESLDLSSNKLTGEIPEDMTSLTFLAVLNLTDNQLVGPIPQGRQFDTFENNSYIGNFGLCGSPLSKKCEMPGPPPSIYDEEDKDTAEFGDGFGWKAVTMGYGCGGVLGLVIGYLVLFTGKPQCLVRRDGGNGSKQRRLSHRSGSRRN